MSRAHSFMSHLKAISDAAMLFVILFSIGLGSPVLATSSLQVTLTLKVDQCTSKNFRFLVFYSYTLFLMEASRYNLRSNRRECSIPVQLQMATNEEFVMASRSHMESAQAGQVFSELLDSGSDIDLSDFIRSLDQICPLLFLINSALTAAGGDSVPGTSGSNSSTSDQAAINPNIQQQLNALGQRLDSIEKNTIPSAGAKPKVRAQARKSKCQNKTKTYVQLPQGKLDVNDAPVMSLRGYVPPLDRLRHELNIQEQVQERLAENAIPGKAKNKSQRGGSVEVFVPHRAKRPHEFVLAGQNKDRVTYNQLSPIQWMAGFFRTIREESDMGTKNTC